MGSFRPHAANCFARTVIRQSECLIQLGRIDKALTTFGATLTALVSPVTGRIHAHYRVAATSTGRATCSGPNMQQIPRDARFRALFIPAQGHVLIVADYASMELRAAAFVSGDPVMTRAFEEGQDLHNITAARMLSTTPDQVSKEERQRREERELRRDLRHRRKDIGCDGVEQLSARPGRCRGQALARRLCSGLSGLRALAPGELCAVFGDTAHPDRQGRRARVWACLPVLPDEARQQRLHLGLATWAFRAAAPTPACWRSRTSTTGYSTPT